ncbi:MAG: TraB/GumN family protein [Chitinophagaceae bacterium]|nr:TraB/GumN family protein [Chitinophagaceae bacterium]
MFKNIRILLLLIACLYVHCSFAQQTKKKGKYPSLFWEITGNGLAKPSYLFGTMHVSSKKVFYLSDSFFYAIKNADVVALENNPELWQENFAEEGIGSRAPWLRFASEMMGSVPNQFVNIKTFAFSSFEKRMELAFLSNPAILNGFLYRNNLGTEDFEEDTFLDMYIFQAGRKLKKEIAGLENLKETNKLVTQAYIDEARSKTKRKLNVYISPDQLEEAYRNGNLDLIDSFQRSSSSDAMLEKMLYRRNEIQGASIDTIIKKNKSLFAGVGAAHLAGPRGVIEYLRKKGYKLRPIFMTERDGLQKEEIEKIRVPLKFTRQYSNDSLFSIEMPGKLFHFDDLQLPNQYQFADMSNGAYYMVTRVPTFATMQGLTPAAMKKKVDSVLYTNIPGKMLSKKNVENSGYKGVEVTSRTRRGDVQRYQIYCTPFEILLFKMSGNGDYVLNGTEADQYFNSLQIKTATTANTFSPAWGGFEVQFQKTPFVFTETKNNVPVQKFAAYDENSGSTYLIIRAQVMNFGFLEEDTFDLNLIDESFASSAMLDEKISSKQGQWQGYPSLDCRYKYKDGSISNAKFVIQGPYYYAIVAHARKELPVHQQFISSFKIKPFVYDAAKKRTDTSIKFTVNSPLFPVQDKSIKDKMKEMLDGTEWSEMANRLDEELNNTEFVTVGGDSTTGERILIIKQKMSPSSVISDSASLFQNKELRLTDSNMVYKISPKRITAGGYDTYNVTVKDTNSSRMLESQVYYRKGIVYIIHRMGDTLTPRSSFAQTMFESFLPTDTATVKQEASSEAELFFKQYFSNDSALKKKALAKINSTKFKPGDLPQFKRAIRELSWKTKDYLRIKKEFIQELGYIDTVAATDYLQELYAAAGDTLELQQQALEALMRQKTKQSYAVFNELMLKDPLILDEDEDNGYNYGRYSSVTVDAGDIDMEDAAVDYAGVSYSHSGFFSMLYDSLALTKTLFPSFFELINLDDYKKPVMRLMGRLVDSGYIKAADYENYYNRFYLEAKQQLKKQLVAEKKKEIESKTKENTEEDAELHTATSDEKDGFSNGNKLLDEYAVLLIPFWDTKPEVPLFFSQLQQLKDREVKYNTSLLLLRHGRKVNDTVWNYFAGMEEFKTRLYDDLAEANKTELFPKKYLTQKQMTYALLANRGNSYYERGKDTLVWLDKFVISKKAKKGWIHFYKYRSAEREGEWKFAYAGIQPLNESEANADDTYISKTQTEVDAEKPLKPQMEKIVKELLWRKRKSAAMFYSSNYDYREMMSREID